MTSEIKASSGSELPLLKISPAVKLLAGLAAFTILSAAVSGAVGIVMMRDFFKKSVDPQAMIETTTYVTGRPDPLPGFSKVMAARINRAVVFLQRPDNTEVSFWRYESLDAVDPDQELDRIYDYGIWTPTKWAHFQSRQKASTKEIDGRTITYWQGQLKDQQGIIYEGLIACLVVGKRVQLLEVIQPSDRPFDIDASLNWLAETGR